MRAHCLSLCVSPRQGAQQVDIALQMVVLRRSLPVIRSHFEPIAAANHALKCAAKPRARRLRAMAQAAFTLRAASVLAFASAHTACHMSVLLRISCAQSIVRQMLRVCTTTPRHERKMNRNKSLWSLSGSFLRSATLPCARQCATAAHVLKASRTCPLSALPRSALTPRTHWLLACAS